MNIVEISLRYVRYRKFVSWTRNLLILGLGVVLLWIGIGGYILKPHGLENPEQRMIGSEFQGRIDTFSNYDRIIVEEHPVLIEVRGISGEVTIYKVDAQMNSEVEPVLELVVSRKMDPDWAGSFQDHEKAEVVLEPGNYLAKGSGLDGFGYKLKPAGELATKVWLIPTNSQLKALKIISIFVAMIFWFVGMCLLVAIFGVVRGFVNQWYFNQWKKI